ncbi:response regulator transcription factor [Streptomyces sp. NPDC091279]|uniref:response regulator transcription factor n=1 Tax=unclassified Streptomyces TaxID=2593676 RepID=UPI0037F4832C
METSTAHGALDERPTLARGAGQQVLVAAGDAELAELLSTTLELAGYRITLVATGAEVLARATERRYDLVVLDAALPDPESFGPDHLPTGLHRPPTLLLTDCDSLERLLPALGPGRRDYVTKPFRVAEVLARMQVLLRAAHAGPRGEGAPAYRDLTLDDSRCQARRGGRVLDLTPAEYRLLRHLLANAHRVLSKEQIGRYVWGEFRGDNAIEQLVSRVRRKVDREGPALIHTRRGFGYWLGEVGADV